jgi:Rrf2 family protein
MISTTGEYALRAIVSLAQHPGRPLTAAELATHTFVPQGYLSKVMLQLAKSGIVKSQRGINGGFTLARDANTVSVLDVLRAVDGAPARILQCPLGIAGHTRLCRMHHLLDEATASIERVFGEATIGALLSDAGGIEALCAPREC